MYIFLILLCAFNILFVFDILLFLAFIYFRYFYLF